MACGLWLVGLKAAKRKGVRRIRVSRPLAWRSHRFQAGQPAVAETLWRGNLTADNGQLAQDPSGILGLLVHSAFRRILCGVMLNNGHERGPSVQ